MFLVTAFLIHKISAIIWYQWKTNIKCLYNQWKTELFLWIIFSNWGWFYPYPLKLRANFCSVYSFVCLLPYFFYCLMFHVICLFIRDISAIVTILNKIFLYTFVIAVVYYRNINLFIEKRNAYIFCTNTSLLIKISQVIRYQWSLKILGLFMQLKLLGFVYVFDILFHEML